MSKTRNPKREGNADFYPTPAWCVHRLLETIVLPHGRWLEPAIGDGAIKKAVNDFIVYEEPQIQWTTIDIRDTKHADIVADYIGIDCKELCDQYFSVVITNPPYNQAMAFVEESLKRARFVIMLLRLNWLASKIRAPFLRVNTPDVYVLPNRPSFDSKGTDSCDYGWFVWDTENHKSRGYIEILETTPLKERQRENNGTKHASD
jgi:hypothetical protein